MPIVILSLLAVASSQIVIEMNDGVRELRIGKTGVRVEVWNRGDGWRELPTPEPGRRWFAGEELVSGRFCDSWD